MKKVYLLVLLSCLMHCTFSQNISWNFGTSSVNASPSTNTTTNLTVSDITFGNPLGTVSNFISTTSASTGYSGSSGQYNAGNAAKTGALDVNASGSAYFEFTLTPDAGYTVSVSALSFGTRSTSTAPQAFSVRTSLDSYASDYATGTISNNSTWALKTPILTTINSATSTPVTIRIYGYNGAGSASSGTINWRIDDLALTVAVTSSSSSSISTGSVSTAPFCVFSTPVSGSVAYTSIGVYNTTFTAYLSDATGSFASPVNVGSATVNGTDPAGSITVSIPAGTLAGSGYKIRIDAASPSVIGSASNAFSVISSVSNASVLTATQGQTTANVSWTNPTSCFNEVLVVVKQGGSITGTPSGNGTAYIADANFGGSGTAFDGGKVVYKGTGTNVNVTGLTTGNNYYIKIFSRYGTDWSTGTEINIPSLGMVNHLVISQVYGGGGNSGATYTNDYIELFNPTNASISLAGYSLQYTSASGNNWSTTKLDLVGSVAAYSYFLVQLGSGGANGIALPTPDQSGIINMSATTGKVTLVNSTIALTQNCPPSTSYVDFVGYGSTADCSESANAPAGSNANSLYRASGGCTDTDNNSADFSAAVAAARNSSSPTNNCSISPGPLPVKFSSFTAKQKGTGVELNWTNETEENLSAYTVERSADGRNYKAIASVKPSKNDNSSASYSNIDASPVNGNNYYRIKATELSGKEVYTNIVRINTASSDADLVIYPNPVKGGELNLQLSGLPKGAYTIKIYNTGGQLMTERSLNHNGGAITESLSITNLKAGIYTVNINGGLQLRKLFVIE